MRGNRGNILPNIGQGKAIRPYRGIAYIASLTRFILPLGIRNLGPMPNTAWGATVRGGDMSCRVNQSGTTA